MALSPAPEGSPAAHFASLLRHHMRVGTRPAAARGTGVWSPDALASEIRLSRRTIDNYCSGSTLPPDVTFIANAFFGDDPRHTLKRAAFLIAFAKATGTEPPPWAFATSNITIRVPAHFFGRDDLMAEVHKALQRQSRSAVALYGLRGAGKTVLAAAYAEHYRGEYRVTWRLRAQTEPTLRVQGQRMRLTV